MGRIVLLACALLVASAAGARSVKIIQPLPPALLGAVQVVATDTVVGDSARIAFDGLEKKAAAKHDAAALVPAAAATPVAAPATDLYPTLPFARMFPLMIADETRLWGLTGGRAVRLAVHIDTLKTADAGMAMLFGSFDELAGIVEVDDAGSGEKLGEFYVDVLNSRSGLLGLAMRGSGVREKLAAEFAKHVGEVLSGRKSRSATTLAAASPPALTNPPKLISYPVESDIMAKTPAQIGLTISPLPAHGPDNIVLATRQDVDHIVTRASEMGGSGGLLNPMSTLLRQIAAARDANGTLDDRAPGVPTLTIAVDSAATLIRCVLTGELKGTCLVRISLEGSARRDGAPLRPLALTTERSIKGVMPSHAVALVSREAALEFLAAAA